MVRFSVAYRLIVSLTLIATGLTACSRDPNVRKHKYVQSGQPTSRMANIVKLRSSSSMLLRSIKTMPMPTTN